MKANYSKLLLILFLVTVTGKIVDSKINPNVSLGEFLKTHKVNSQNVVHVKVQQPALIVQQAGWLSQIFQGDETSRVTMSYTDSDGCNVTVDHVTTHSWLWGDSAHTENFTKTC
jgi:hypothetical protein